MNPLLMKTILPLLPRLFFMLVPVIITVKEKSNDKTQKRKQGEESSGDHS